MEKLTIKELAPYLPYRLKIMVHNDFEMELTHKRVQDSFEDDLKFISIDGVLKDYHCKPILRPLSDLTKEIEVNGKKFIPIEWIRKHFYKDLTPYQWKNNNLELDIETESYTQTIDLFDGFLITQKLLEWHFDVFGLIEKGLAIDKNTI